jgi:serine/threonine-protein kinase
MDAERWRRLEELFHAAAERPAEEREDFLESCCPDPTLRREVLDLLAHDADPAASTGLGAAVAGAAGRALQPEPAQRWEGRRIGAYRVEREIGRGGMGVVLLAERTDGAFEKKVAIKLSLAGLVSAPLAERLESERRILATLDHPAIARLLDGGTTDEGIPYVVMELVEGTPIDAHCARRQLDVRSRIRLFLEVCDAVEHAHRSLIVHRDIKPGNILVTPEGRPKLLDFGIAKLLDADPVPDRVATTHSMLRALTPEYASPEQLRGEPITTSADVYGLGVVLYELLTGSRPFTLDSLTPAEVERALLAQSPSRPSSVCKGAAARALRGDLDRIVLMALRKEPGRRYATARELAEDLRRFLEGRPVRARADTPGYRLRRFVGRHRAATVAAVLAAAALAGGLTYHVDRLGDERDRALREAEKSSRIAQYLEEIFTANVPSTSKGDEVTAIELLDRASAGLGEELASEPELRVDMLVIMGNTYRSLAAYERSEALLKEALRIQRDNGWSETKRHAEVLVSLGALLATQDRIGEAAEVTERARDVFSAAAPASPEAATALHNLAELRFLAARYDEAVDLAEEAHQRRVRIFAENHPRSLASLRLIARAHSRMGSYDLARSVLEQVLEGQRTRLGDKHAQTAKTLSELATVESHRENFQRAASLMERALDIRQSVFPEDHPTVAVTMVNLAGIVEELGRYERAEALCRTALDLLESRLPSDHAEVIMTRSRLAGVLGLQGRFDQALALQRSALAQLRERYGSSHPRVVLATHNLAASEHDFGDYASARERLEEVVAAWKSIHGPTHKYVAFARGVLGKTLIELADPEAGRAELLAARRIAAEALGERTPVVAAHRFHLGRAALMAGDTDAAREHLNASLALREQLFEEEAHFALADSHHGLGELALALERWEEAVTRFERGLEMRRAIHGGAHYEVVLSLTGVARAQLAAGRMETGCVAAGEAVAMAREVSAPPHTLGRALVTQARCRAATGSIEEARVTLTEGLRHLERCHPPHHPVVTGARELLARLSDDEDRSPRLS